jgi:hypothetical protein
MTLRRLLAAAALAAAPLTAGPAHATACAVSYGHDFGVVRFSVYDDRGADSGRVSDVSVTVTPPAGPTVTVYRTEDADGPGLTTPVWDTACGR